MKPIILIIDDDKEFAEEFSFLLKNDYTCLICENAKAGIEKIKSGQIDVVLLDLMLGNENGIEVLTGIKKVDEDCPVIMITEYASLDTAVLAIKRGAEDYVSKTPNLNELKLAIEKSLKQKMRVIKERAMKEEINKPFHKIIGSGNAILKLRETIELVAETNNTILITGESGVGKELIARQIHAHSNREKDLFVTVNCAAIPDSLLESELFGHEKGAFTGAILRKIGKFELASEGTIFLDEISELRPVSQVKLLRVLQEKEFERVGGNTTIKTNARVIAATNRNLKKLVDDGFFRQDLYFRLDVFPIEVPPLREHKEDIPELAEHFIKAISYDMKLTPPGITNDAMEILLNYNWEGNVRELINYLTRAIMLSRGNEINAELISKPILSLNQSGISIPMDLPLKWDNLNKLRKKAAGEASRKVEKEFVKRLLNKFDGNISKAAQYAGIDRSNLHRMIKRINLQ